MSARSGSPLPAIILTGTLGAGKTTVLNDLIAAEPSRRVAVVENEAGEVSVDRDLLGGAVVDVVGGCACCTLRGELHAALDLLSERIGEIDAVAVEASGIADPVAIIQAFQASGVRELYRLGGLVAVVDAEAGHPPAELVRQVRFADAVVLTKLDRVGPGVRPAIEMQLSQLAPEARALDREQARSKLGDLFERVSAGAAAAPTEERQDPDHGFTAVTIGTDAALEEAALRLWLSALALSEPSLVRVKGIAAGSERPLLVQGVGTRIEVSAGPAWIGSRRRTRLVMIGRELDRERLQAGLEGCRA